MSDSAAPPNPSELGRERDEAAQLRQLQSYVASVSGLFEQVLSDLLLEQPADPHAFLLQRLQAMPVSEREQLKATIAAQDERHNGHEDPSFNRANSKLIVVLTLTVKEEAGCKESVIETLKMLQQAAHSNPGCQRYEICHSTSTAEICVNQAWANQSSLVAFYSSAEFAAATPQLAGKLGAIVDERVYSGPV